MASVTNIADVLGAVGAVRAAVGAVRGAVGAVRAAEGAGLGVAGADRVRAGQCDAGGCGMGKGAS